MNKITPPKWPVTLVDSDWKKKSKTVSDTGIGKTLRSAQKLFEQIRWDYIKNFESIPAAARVIEEENNKTLGMFWAGFSIKNLDPVERALSTVVKTVESWNNKANTKDAKTKPAIDAAKIIAKDADNLIKELADINDKIRKNIIEFEKQPPSAEEKILKFSGRTIFSIDPFFGRKDLNDIMKGDPVVFKITYSFSQFEGEGKMGGAFPILVANRLQKLGAKAQSDLYEHLKSYGTGKFAKKDLVEIISYVKNLGKETEVKAKAIPREVWNDYVKGKKEYAKFIQDVKTDIERSAINIAIASGGVLAGASTGGISLILALIKIMDNLIKIAKSAQKLSMETSKAGKDAKDMIRRLVEEYKLAKKTYKIEFAKDVANTAFTSFIDLPFFDTVARAEKKFNIWSAKISGSLTASIDLGENLQTAIDAIQKCEKELKKLTGNTKDKNIKKALEKLKTMDKAADKYLKEIINHQNVYEKNEPQAAKALVALNSLKVSRREEIPKFFDQAKAAIPLILTMATTIIDPPVEAYSKMEVFIEGAQTVNDLIEEFEAVK